MNEEVLQIRHEGDVTTLTLARPGKMNALSADLVEQLLDGVDQAAQRGSLALVLQGEGRNFSAGFDFGGLADHSDGDLLLRFVRIETLLQRLAASPCLTIAYAHGRNFGAGVDLFAACRLRYAAPQATFRMPGLRFGLVLGSRRFAGLVGAGRARDILENGRTFSAQQAVEMGFAAGQAGADEWPGVLAGALQEARALPAPHRARLYATLSTEAPDTDLAHLVRSAAEPGLKARIEAYLQA